jgi:hypothetical protein
LNLVRGREQAGLLPFQSGKLSCINHSYASLRE